MKNHIIGLTGFAGVGKDTVADILTIHFGFRKLAFADTLRGEVAEAFGVDLAHLVDPVAKHMPMAALAMSRAPRDFLAAVHLAGHGISDQWLQEPRTPRQIMQWWGTEYRREQHPRYWTRALLEKLCVYQRQGERRLVVTDVRFENEADTLRAAGAIVWQVTRPGINVSTTHEGAHVSVTDGAKFRPSAVIANTHDLRHLQQLVLSEFVALDTGIAGAKVTVPA